MNEAMIELAFDHPEGVLLLGPNAGLKKCTLQLFTLLALSNLWMVRGKLMQMQS